MTLWRSRVEKFQKYPLSEIRTRVLLSLLYTYYNDTVF